MPFTQDDDQHLRADFHSGNTKLAKDRLLKINTLYDEKAKSDLKKMGEDFAVQLKDSKDKASFAAIMRLIDLHTQGEKLKAGDSDLLLKWAFKNHDADLFKILVQTYDANVDTDLDENWNTALHLAVKAGDTDTVKKLVRTFMADVDRCNDQAETPLFIAVATGNTALVEFLLKNGANIHTTNNVGDTLLHAAARNNDVGMMAFLLENKAQIHAKNNQGAMPLHAAAEAGSIGAIRWLIKNRANIEARDEKGNTPFHAAASKGRIDALGVLKKYGANTRACNWQGSLPIHRASTRETVEFLLKDAEKEKPFDINTANKQGATLLMNAAQSGDLEWVKFLIEKKASVNVPDKDGQTALLVAAANGHGEVVKYLVSHGADINIRDNYDFLPLHRAAKKGDEQTFKYLIEQHKKEAKSKGVLFDINTFEQQKKYMSYGIHIPHRYNNTVLHLAAESGNLGLVQFLVEDEKANCNIKNYDDKDTALHVAAKNGHVNVVNFLVSRTDINARNKQKALPLHYVAGKGYKNTVEVLIQRHKQEAKEKGAAFDINTEQDSDEKTALHWAAKSDNLELVRFLVVDEKANIHLKNESGMTAFHFAAQNGCLEVMEYLVSCGADVNTRGGFLGKDLPLHHAAEKGHEKAVKYIIQLHKKKAKDENKPFDINTPGSSEQTALHKAVENGNLALVKFLVEDEKADVNLKDRMGEAALDLAARCSHTHIVKYLVNECGMDINHRDSNENLPLILAAGNNNRNTLVWLIQEAKRKGQLSPINTVNCHERSALHEAAWRGDLALMKFLMSQGADPRLKDDEGATALHLAAAHGHVHVMEYLVDEYKLNVEDRQRKDEEIEDRNLTPLHLGAHNGHLPAVQWLIEERKANIEAQTKNGNTALHFAAKYSYFEMVNLLCSRQPALVHVKNKEGRTALHEAVEEEEIETVECLVNTFCADVNVKNSKNNAPLHRAVSLRNEKIVKCLLKAGADLGLKDEKGNSVLDLAAEDPDHPEILHLIKDFSPPSDDDKKNLHRNLRVGQILSEITKLGLEHPKLNKPSLIKLAEESLMALGKGMCKGKAEAELDDSAKKIITALYSKELQEDSHHYWKILKTTLQSLPQDSNDEQITDALKQICSPSSRGFVLPVEPTSIDKPEQKEREEKGVPVKTEVDPAEQDLPAPLSSSSSSSSGRMEPWEMKSSVPETKEGRPEPSIKIEPKTEILPSLDKMDTASDVTLTPKEEKHAEPSVSSAPVSAPMPSFASGWWWDAEFCAKQQKNVQAPKRKRDKNDVSGEQDNESHKKPSPWTGSSSWFPAERRKAQINHGSAKQNHRGIVPGRSPS